MATYTVTTNAQEENALTFGLTRVNAARAINGQPALTAAQYVDQLVRSVLRDHAARDLEEQRQLVIATLRDNPITAGQASQLKTVLGL